VLALGAFAIQLPAEAKQIVVQVAPPAMRVEEVPPPRHGYHWAPGYWSWNHNKHVWVGGHWIKEKHGYHWTAPRWEERNGHWHFHDGRWDK